ncbi:DNA/RNA-binding domain of Phe-tRNA-synthetase-like protein [Pseudonocardia eucalypti]|uniref:B3/B4 domain-containing protein n=1 Tax=Pseudonocardia eucalypti TaxID=648755 RepID=UPI00181F1872|nr:DNA/RNA-binding domain of Phe-tRNA-synthetase-like protein [Pseudonocardia eucalypti]
MTVELQSWLSAASIDGGVRALRPDYRALLVLADDLEPGPSDAVSERMLAAAEERARELFRQAPVLEHPHVLAWREAFRDFGAKPRRTRPSMEALLRRLDEGLPRINRLADAYNAISIAHVVPIGGEDVSAYRGPLRLVRATGGETFDTVAGGEPALENPEPGEVVWRDNDGVTCRRWNWRQCTRTRLTEQTTKAVFLLDALSPMTDTALRAAANELMVDLRTLSPQARFTTRLLP